MLGNIVEVADISVTIPSNGADNETGRLGCPGPCLCRGALDHLRNSEVGRQEVRLESALESIQPSGRPRPIGTTSCTRTSLYGRTTSSDFWTECQTLTSHNEEFTGDVASGPFSMKSLVRILCHAVKLEAGFRPNVPIRRFGRASPA